jgi:hypothetical protein
MANLKTRYRKYRDGGAVPADDTAAMADVTTPTDLPALEAKALTEEQQLIDNLEMPSAAKEWLKERPQYVFDAQENARIRVVHNALLREGHEPYSPSYFAEAEKRLAEPEEVDRSAVDEALAQARAAAPVEDVFDHENSRLRISPRRVAVSAPPSREVPSSNGSRDQGRVTLSLQQKEAARISGISEEEYAMQMLRLRQEKEAGHYTGGQ